MDKDRRRTIMIRTLSLLALVAATPGLVAGYKDTPHSEHALHPEAQSRTMVWNAVAVDGTRVFVAGPRWAGNGGPQLARIGAGGALEPYPDARWNAWRAGGDNADAFVNINAIHRDASNGLWVVDTGSPEFGGDPLPGGAKLVRIDLRTNRVSRVIPLGPTLAKPGSYIDDIRFHGTHAYLTDAGNPGLIVIDLTTGTGRRVLDHHPAATARPDRPIVLDGEIVKSPDGQPLKVQSDPLEVSVDGRWLFFGPLEGPWSRVPTRLLDDPAVSPDALAAAVEPWADLPPVGGTAMGPDGSLFFNELATNSVKRRYPDGRIETLARDPALHWVDAPFLDPKGGLWLPVAQLDRVALFHQGKAETQWPIKLYRLETR
jgi:hypothetical protein